MTTTNSSSFHSQKQQSKVRKLLCKLNDTKSMGPETLSLWILIDSTEKPFSAKLNLQVTGNRAAT